MTSRAAGTRTRPGRALALVLSVGLLATVLTSCLMPGEHDPTGRAPVGNIDFAVAVGASIRVTGWALDPETAAPIEVAVAFHGTTTRHLADVDRPDIGAAYPGNGSAHGFDVRSPILGTGVKQVCVVALNVGIGDDRVLGCQDIQTGQDLPVGSFDTLTQQPDGSVLARGWAFDGEYTDSSTPVTYTVDGGAPALGYANVPRPDVNAFFGIAGSHGFDLGLWLPLGTRTVCVTAKNVDRGWDVALGCHTVEVNTPTSVAPGAGISAVQPVGPPAGHPLTGIDRDGGISTRLRDGSILWLFGDSAEPRSTPGYRYFVNNTAAWAAAGSPTVTRDAVAAGRVPYTFVAPAAAFTTPCPMGFTAVMWPLSATAVPYGEMVTTRDRVIAFFGNVCLRGTEAKSRGVAVVEYVYDHQAVHDGARIQGTVLRQNMFPVGAEYGTASMVDGDFLYAYECGRPSDDTVGVIWPNDPAYTGCTAARVELANLDVAGTTVADPTQWRYWNGSGWVNTPQPGALMTIPSVPNNPQTPVSSFSISNDPHYGYTMTYSPWPGYTDEVYVRTGSSPTGPWSAARLVKLPNCNEYATGAQRLCYAATAQPWRSQPGQLGIGWFDQYVAWNPTRGSYLSGNAPF
jgi:hypothetical protein